MPRYIVDGFVFHVNAVKGNSMMTYLRCLEYKRLGCHARAVIPSSGNIKDIQIRKEHNHPPDYTAEEKIIFMRELRSVLERNPDSKPKEVYDALSQIYPQAARQLPFYLLRQKLYRWKKNESLD